MRLLIAVPTYGLWQPRFGHSLALTMATLPHVEGMEMVHLSRCDSTILPAGRSDLAKDALETGATHVLWCDTDMQFRPDNVLGLLSHDVDIVGVDYVKRLPPHETTALGLDGAPVPPGDGLVEVGRIGLGLAVMKAAIFEALPKPWFAYPWRDDIDDFVGEDSWFCRHARKHGFKVFVDRDASRGIGHVGSQTFEVA